MLRCAILRTADRQVHGVGKATDFTWWCHATGQGQNNKHHDFMPDSGMPEFVYTELGRVMTNCCIASRQMAWSPAHLVFVLSVLRSLHSC